MGYKVVNTMNGTFLENIGSFLNPDKGEPNIKLQVELDNASLLKLGGVIILTGTGLIILNKLIKFK